MYLPYTYFILFCVASNILLKMTCSCGNILSCTCPQQRKAVVKLGGLSSCSCCDPNRSTAIDIQSFGYLLLHIFIGEHVSANFTSEEQVRMVVIFCMVDNNVHILLHRL